MVQANQILLIPDDIKAYTSPYIISISGTNKFFRSFGKIDKANEHNPFAP